MIEPYATQFRDLILGGAAHQDIHDIQSHVGYAATCPSPSTEYIEREVQRAEMHRKKLLPLLEPCVGKVDSILDVGCSTGGTTVALATSAALGARRVVGVDPNRLSLQAAEVRAKAYGIAPALLEFRQITPGNPLPFPDDSFQLVVCVSVLEFVTTPQARRFLISELVRAAKPEGFIYLATPNALSLREYHTRRWFGNLRHGDGDPWSSMPWFIRRTFRGCRRISLRQAIVDAAAQRLGTPWMKVMTPIAPLVMPFMKWQRFLFQKKAAA